MAGLGFSHGTPVVGYSGCRQVVAGQVFSHGTLVVIELWQVWGFLLVLRLSASGGRSGVFSWYCGCQRVVAVLGFSPGTAVFSE